MPAKNSVTQDPQIAEDQPIERPNENVDDLAAQFVLSQDFNAALGLETQSAGPELRKPEKHEWFRVMPGVGWPAFLLKAGSSRDDEYIVTPPVAKHVPEDCRPIILRPVCNSAQHKFLWPLAVPDSVKPHAAHIGAKHCAELAEKEWVRMRYAGSGYVHTTATANMPEPEWPSDPRQLLNLVLEVKGITDPAHEVVQRLVRGG
jgi:hypothetical protein